MKTKIFFILILSAFAVFPQVNLTSSNLPIFIINTNGKQIPDEPKITVHLGIIYNGEGVRNNITDQANHYNGNIEIEIRGSSSQMYPKKSYAVQTVDQNGNSVDTSLLGLPSENDWIFYGPYSDKSLIRDVISYKLFSDMNHYSSRSKFFELIINGEYVGVYALLEKIKRDKNRVDISKLNPEDNFGDELTGGYIIKIDKTDGAINNGWYSDFLPFNNSWQKILYQYHYPEGDEITYAQSEYIKSKVYEFESCMNASSFNHPFLGYYDKIGLDSFADGFLIFEFTRNVDGYRLSTFFHKDKDSNGGKIKFGPIWDFNFTLGNADYYNAWETEGWQLYVDFTDDPFQKPFWWRKLMTDKIFTNRIISRWNQLRQNALSNQKIFGMIDSLNTLLNEAQQRNFNKWKILGTYIWPNYFVGNTFASEINYLKSWINYRLNWLDKTIPKDYSEVNWKNYTETISMPPNSSLSVPLSQFYKSFYNVDKFTVVVKNSGLNASIIDTNLIIESKAEGENKIKLIGWKGVESREISKSFNIHVGVVGVDEKEFPNQFDLAQNFPNPFNPSTTIRYSLSNNVMVSLKVFDLLGNEIAVLVNEQKTAGNYAVEFDAGYLSSGVYFYQLRAGNFLSTKKMILMK